jgi:hypothetical protein
LLDDCLRGSGGWAAVAIRVASLSGSKLDAVHVVDQIGLDTITDREFEMSGIAAHILTSDHVAGAKGQRVGGGEGGHCDHQNGYPKEHRLSFDPA